MSPLARAVMLGLAFAVLLPACGSDAPGGLRRYRGQDLSFVYPESWELTQPPADAQAPEARVLVLRASADTVVLLYLFKPTSGWRLDEFAEEFSQQRRLEFVRQGASRPRGLERAAIQWSSRGRPLEGIRDDFEVERDGVVSRQTSLFFELERDDAQIFVSAHLPTPRLPELTVDLKALLGSLRGGSIA